MKAVRFRCPKCQTSYSAQATRAGQAFVCKTCFGPLVVPGGAEIPSPSTSTEIEPSPRTRFNRRSMIATAALVAAFGAVVGLQRLSDFRGDNPLLTVNPQDGVKAQVLPAPAPEPQPAPEVKPPAPAPDSVVESAPPAVLVVDVDEPVPPSPSDPNRPLVIRRRQMLDQEALRRQLAELPELAASDKTEKALVALHHVILPMPQAQGLSPQERRRIASQQRTRRQNVAATEPDEEKPKPGMHVVRDEGAPRNMLAMIQQNQPELASLPWRMGDECHLGRECAEDLQVVSRALRTLLAQSTPQGDTRPDADLLRAAILEEPAEEEGSPQSAQAQATGPQQRRRPGNGAQLRFVKPAAIPALQQLLMAERTPVRQVLVDVLDKIAGKESVKALARLAMFDLAGEVRERALLALRSRPAEDYRPSFVEGLRYPWAPVADHAAEALVALGDREAVSSLVPLLDQPDPLRPRTELRDGKPVTLAPALVQVNHLQNCVLCHAPSGDPVKDFVRGRVPEESKPLPPPVEYYANSSPGLFVRADVTYLRQDFSVTQPVQDPGPWPAFQRYDYLLTEKPVSRWSSHVASGNPDEYPQRESVLFALRELTGRDLGTRSSDWKAEVRAKALLEPARPQSE